MEFKNSEDLMYFVKGLKYIGSGSSGKAFYSKKTNKVYKIYDEFFDYDPECSIFRTEEEVLRFKNEKSGLAVFPEDVIRINGYILGEVQPVALGKNLYKINPLRVNLDNFSQAISNAYDGIILLSKKGIRTYDVTYNTMYNPIKDGKISMIDTIEWSYSGKSTDELIRENINNFSYEICLFLVDEIFDSFVESNVQLKSLYKDKEDAHEFVGVFRKVLSEAVGKKVETLADAKKLFDKKLNNTIFTPEYERSVYIKR